MRYQTPWNKVLWGIRPRGTPFEYENLPEFVAKYKNFSGVNQGPYGVDSCKNQFTCNWDCFTKDVLLECKIRMGFKKGHEQRYAQQLK